MIWMAMLLLVIGVFLSAFFSGCETGLYRASRVRLVMDGLEGSRIARALLSLLNNPTLFVATTLIGNNVANYMTSLAIVLAAQALYSNSVLVELAAPILFAPLLFVYAELLPKNMFYAAPNRLLRLGAPLFLVATVVFAPISAILWGLGRVLERLLGESPEKVRFSIAKQELRQALHEGQEAGILKPTQRFLGQNFFLVASNRLGEVCIPPTRLITVPDDALSSDVLRIAGRNRITEIAVTKNIPGRPASERITGYVRISDLIVRKENSPIQQFVRPLIDLPADELFGEALIKMQTNRESMARVSRNEQTIGLVTLKSLTDPLLVGPLATLRY